MYNSFPVEEMLNNMDRNTIIKENEQFANCCIITALVLRKMVKSMLKKADDAKLIMDRTECIQWNHILRATGILDDFAFKADAEQYKDIKKEVQLCEFLFLELIAKCDCDNVRLWQFHNLLKSFPTVFKALQPTIDEELEAFKDVFGNKV